METIFNCSSQDKLKRCKIFSCNVSKKYVLYFLSVDENNHRISSDSKAFDINAFEEAKSEALNYCK